MDERFIRLIRLLLNVLNGRFTSVADHRRSTHYFGVFQGGAGNVLFRRLYARLYARLFTQALLRVGKLLEDGLAAGLDLLQPDGLQQVIIVPNGVFARRVGVAVCGNVHDKCDDGKQEGEPRDDGRYD